jgi:hypothetical protein
MHATRPHYPKPTMGELSPPAIHPCDRQRGCVAVSMFREDVCRGSCWFIAERGDVDLGELSQCGAERTFLQELPRFAKGHQILGHSVASGADLPRTSTNSYSSHTSSRELFRCSRGPADTHDAIQHAHRSPVFKAAPHTVLYPGPISPHPYPCSRSTTRCPRHPIVLRSASSSSEISSLLK